MPKEYKSLDPRVNRIPLPMDADQPHAEDPIGQWQTFEVFTQQKRGEQHVHVGALHAPNAEMALILAKEQFGRREQCANLWVVRSGDILATSYEDADMFKHAFDKNYREGDGYRVKYTIEAFTKDLDERLGLGPDGEKIEKKATPDAQQRVQETEKYRIYNLPEKDNRKRRILVKK